MEKILELATCVECDINKISSEIKEKKKNERKLFINSLGSKVKIYEIHSTRTLSPTESKKILIFDFYIKKEKNLKFIIKKIYELFNKKKDIYLFLLFKDDNDCKFISFNLKSLNNNLINTKYFFISKKIFPNDFKNWIDFEQIKNTSIYEMFDEMCKRVIYFNINKKPMENNNTSWEIIQLQKNMLKCNTEIVSLRKKARNTYNAQKRIIIDNEIKEINNKLEKIKESIKKLVKN